MTNIIKANFGNATVCRTAPAYQYDYGQLLNFPELDLPASFECHFSNNERGTSVTQIGSENTVTIPDAMFQSGAYIYAWVFLHTGEDDGETEYMVIIPVLNRARPSDTPPTPVEQSAITQAIAALNAAVEQTGQDVIDAAASASEAEAAAQSVIDGAAQIAKNTADIKRLNAGVNVLFDFHKSDLTWGEIDTLVKGGEMSEIFPVGSQIEDTWEDTSETSVTFPWDVVHYANNGDAFLKWHYAAPEAPQFDAPEAIYYFDGTEPSGTYHIPIGSSYGKGWVEGHSIQFTLTDAPDEGDQLFIDCGANSTNDPANGRTWTVYNAGGTTAKQSGTTSEGTDGTSLGTIGNVSIHRTNGHLNAITRTVYGYGRWSQSAMRQYLNSAEVSWWTMKNPWDRPPAQASTIRGFLCGFSQDFLNHLEETEVVTAINTQEGLAESTETTLDKIFLPSLEQMYIIPQIAGVEGEPWDYYKALAAAAGLPGEFQANQNDKYPILISYAAVDTSSAVIVYLRSCNIDYTANEWIVYTNGSIFSTVILNRAIPGCPACVFHKS